MWQPGSYIGQNNGIDDGLMRVNCSNQLAGEGSLNSLKAQVFPKALRYLWHGCKNLISRQIDFHKKEFGLVSDHPLLAAVMVANNNSSVCTGNVDFVALKDGADRFLGTCAGSERMKARAGRVEDFDLTVYYFYDFSV